MGMSYTGRMSPVQCPACGKEQDAYTGPMRAQPGDLVVCGYCGTANRFGPQLQLEAMTRADLAELADTSPDSARALANAQAAVFAFRAVDQVRKRSKRPL